MTNIFRDTMNREMTSTGTEEENRAANRPPAIKVVMSPSIVGNSSVIQKSRSLWVDLWWYIQKKLFGERKSYDKQIEKNG